MLKDGWLPDYDFDFGPVLKRTGQVCHTRFMTVVNAGPASSHAYLDAARESVLYNFHRARNGTVPCDEWLDSVASVYRRGLAMFPASRLPACFNSLFVSCSTLRNAETVKAEGLRLLDETLVQPVDEWTLDLMEDVFPWDFYPQFFNYRAYFDLITSQLTDGTDVRPGLCQLLLASLNYYRGFHAPYMDFNGQALDYFRSASTFDPSFPYYQYHLAEVASQLRFCLRMTPRRFVCCMVC